MYGALFNIYLFIYYYKKSFIRFFVIQMFLKRFESFLHLFIILIFAAQNLIQETVKFWHLALFPWFRNSGNAPERVMKFFYLMLFWGRFGSLIF